MMNIAIALGISSALNDIDSKSPHSKFTMPWIWLTYLYLGSDIA